MAMMAAMVMRPPLVPTWPTHCPLSACPAKVKWMPTSMIAGTMPPLTSRSLLVSRRKLSAPWRNSSEPSAAG
eukprot:3617487-Heterocapsa_arctica.AAC.1